MKPKRDLSLLLLALLCLGVNAPSAVAREGTDVIADPDYQFRLRRPGPDWVLLPEADVRNIVPDAVVGARMPASPAVHACVIVERVPKEDLDWYASLVLDNMPLENRRIIQKEDITFQGIPARKTLIAGRVNNVDVRYQVVMLFRKGFAFQFMAWGLAGLTKPDGADFQPFFEAISFTEGPMRVRAYVAKMRDTIGTGWEVKDNQFHSVISGLKVAPPEGWRLAIGDELSSMNDDAEVGLISTKDPDIYMVFTTERAAGVPRSDMETQYAVGLTENQRRSTTVPPLEAAIAGQPVTLALYGGKAEQPFDYRHGVFWDGDMGTQALIWYARPRREVATKEILRALAGVTKLSDADRSALRQRLMEAGDQQAFVGPTYSLRKGRFTDFASGVTWTAPKGIWKLSTGQAARAFVEGATLVIESPGEGLIGVLRHDHDLDMDAATYHHSVLEALWGKDDAAKALVQTKEVKVPNQAPLRMARAVRDVNTQQFTYVVATGMHNKIGTRLMVWGYPGNVASSVQWLKEALWGLNLIGAPRRAAEKRDDRWIDHRLGFEMRAPNPQWRFREETPAALKAVGSLVGWAGRSERVQVLGMCNIGIAENTRAVLNAMLGNASKPFGGKPAVSAVRIQGVPAELRSWPNRANIWSLVRGRMIYLLIHEWQSGTKPSVTSGDVLGRFKLQD